MGKLDVGCDQRDVDMKEKLYIGCGLKEIFHCLPGLWSLVPDETKQETLHRNFPPKCLSSIEKKGGFPPLFLTPTK